ncbi:hypothetical protein KKA39_02790 [Patescibacteria group bacterium]|nr:hypothetical protein [Patescibacteria group bacterium]MBU1728203.1 hypothetical protein [Patescibacteria group bacterium]
MKKIKHFIQSEKGKDILIILIIILAGLGSFELGRLSKENPQNGLKIEYKDKETEIAYIDEPNQVSTPNISKTGTKSAPGNYFASSRGKKYYPTGCSAGNTIKQENRIYFSSSSEAEQAGYTLSSSCN